MHGVAWFKASPDVVKLLSTKDDTAVEEVTSYADA